MFPLLHVNVNVIFSICEAGLPWRQFRVLSHLCGKGKFGGLSPFQKGYTSLGSYALSGISQHFTTAWLFCFSYVKLLCPYTCVSI